MLNNISFERCLFMNKKQFATKLIASMLSAYFLVPCTSTFGVDSQPESEEAVSLSEKNQEALNDEDTQESEDAQEDENKQKSEDTQKVKDKKKGQKKTILRNPYVQVVGGGIGLGALIFGGSRLWKRFSSGRHPQSPADGGSVTPPAAPVEPQTLPEDRTGWNELHDAAEADNLEAFNGLTIADQRLRQRDTRGRTPFYIAVKYHPESQIIRNWLDGLDHKLHTVGEGEIGDELFSHIIYDTLVTAVRNDDVRTLTNLVNTVMTNYTPNSEIEPNPAIYFGFEVRENGRVFDIALREHHTAAAQCLLAIVPSCCTYGVAYNSDIHQDPQARLTELRELRRQGLSLESLAGNSMYIANALRNAITQFDIFRFYVEECHALTHLAPMNRTLVRMAISQHIDEGDGRYNPTAPHPITSAQARELLTYFGQKCEEIPYVAPQQ